MFAMAARADRAGAIRASDVVAVECDFDAIRHRGTTANFTFDGRPLDAQIAPRIRATVRLRLVDARLADLPANSRRAEPCDFGHGNLRRAVVSSSLFRLRVS